MTSRTLLNLALLLIVLILVALVVLEPGKTPEPEAVLLTDLKDTDVSKVKIVRKDRDTIELEKKSGHWQMLAPYALPANDYKVASVLKLLATETAARYNLSDLDPARFDLLTPALSISFNDSLKIDFGNTEPLQKQRYVRIDRQLYLIPDYYYYQLVGTSTDYLDHALIPKGEKIIRLELPDLTLALKEGKWTLSPENKDYSADAYTDLLNEWQHAHAVELRAMKSEDKKNPSNKPLGKQIRVFLQGSEIPIRYTLHRTEDEFVLIRPDKNIEYVMASDKADALLGLQKSTPDVEPDSGSAQDK